MGGISNRRYIEIDTNLLTILVAFHLFCFSSSFHLLCVERTKQNQFAVISHLFALYIRALPLVAIARKAPIASSSVYAES